MQTIIRAAAFAVIALTLAGTSSPLTAKGRCVMAGGEANMLTEDLARFMANAALQNSIKDKGLKPSGKVNMACSGTGLTHCIARQRACG